MHAFIDFTILATCLPIEVFGMSLSKY